MKDDKARRPQAKRKRVKSKGRRGRTPTDSRPLAGSGPERREAVAPESPGGLRWIYGVQPVLEALKSRGDRVEKIWLAYGRSGPSIQRILEQAKGQKVPVSYKGRAALDAKAGTAKHQGLLALLSGIEALALAPFLRRLSADRRRFLVLLDAVQDPHNLGAILRTACACGVEGVLLPKHRTSPLTPAAVKASAGAATWVPLVRVGNAAEALRSLRRKGIFVIGADASAKETIYDQDFRRDVCVVIGGEAKGLRPVIRQLCDGLVSIPMAGPIDSLNASVAAGILFYEAVRQRREFASKADGPVSGEQDPTPPAVR